MRPPTIPSHPGADPDFGRCHEFERGPVTLAPGYYKVQVVHGDPVYSPISVTFVVNSFILTITASTTLIYVGQPVSLTAAGCGPGSTYRWSTVITCPARSTSLVSGPDAFGDALIEGAEALPGMGEAAETDKPQAILFRPARDPRGSGK